MRMLALALLGVLACGSDNIVEPPDPPQLEGISLSVVSGDNQTAMMHDELPDPLVVQVKDQDSVPLPNYVVNFVVVEGSGSMFAGVSRTDNSGMAQDYWTLGPQPGAQSVEVRAVNPTTGVKQVFATFAANATIPFDSVPSRVGCNLPTGWSQVSGEPCQWGSYAPNTVVPVMIKVRNAASQPIPGITVEFQVDALCSGVCNNLGTLDSMSTETDAAGNVTANWTLGPNAGWNSLNVRFTYAGGTYLVNNRARGIVPVTKWICAQGEWYDDNCWDTGTAPTHEDSVVIDISGTVFTSDSTAYAKAIVLDHPLAVLDNVYFATPLDLSGGSLVVLNGALLTSRIANADIVVYDKINLLPSGYPGDYINVSLLVDTPGLAVFENNCCTMEIVNSHFVFNGAVLSHNGPGMIFEDSSTMTFGPQSVWTIDEQGILAAAREGHYAKISMYGRMVFHAKQHRSSYFNKMLELEFEFFDQGGFDMVEEEAIPTGTAYDVLRVDTRPLGPWPLFIGTPVNYTSDYTLVLNPEVGVGARLIKN